jgi:hypothetical protein
MRVRVDVTAGRGTARLDPISIATSTYEDLEMRYYGNKEIAGYDAMGMIVEEGRPSLILGIHEGGAVV